MRPLVSRDDGEASTTDASTKTITKRRPRGLKFVPALFVVVALGLALQGAFAQTAAAETGVPCPQTGMETVATDAAGLPARLHGPRRPAWATRRPATSPSRSRGPTASSRASRPRPTSAGNLEYDYLLPPPPGVIGDYGLDILGLEGVLASMTFTDATKTWTGATSTEWNLAGNWVAASQPNDDVTIPANVASGRYPVVSTAAAAAKSVTLATGAGTQPSLTVSANTLTISGNGGLSVDAGTVTHSGGTIAVTSGAVSITGTLNETGGTSSSSVTMTVNNGGNISVSGTGVIHMATTLVATPTDNLVVNNGGTVSQSAGSFDVRDFTSSAGDPRRRTPSRADFQVVPRLQEQR